MGKPLEAEVRKFVLSTLKFIRLPLLDAVLNDVTFTARMMLPSSMFSPAQWQPVAETRKKQIDIHVDKAELKLTDEQYQGIFRLIFSLLQALPPKKTTSEPAVTKLRKEKQLKNAEIQPRKKSFENLALRGEKGLELQQQQQEGEEGGGWFSYISKVAWEIVADSEYVSTKEILQFNVIITSSDSETQEGGQTEQPSVKAAEVAVGFFCGQLTIFLATEGSQPETTGKELFVTCSYAAQIFV